MTQTPSIQFIDLPYQSTLLLTHFAAIANIPWAMLLHSPAKGHADARFDILVADPIATLTHQEGENALRIGDDAPTYSTDDPFTLLKTVQETLLPNTQHNSDWPFIGGALGYFSYDLGRQIEPMPNLAIDDIKMPQMAVGIYDWALMLDNQQKKAVLVQRQGEDRLAWLHERLAAAATSTGKGTSSFALTRPWQSNTTWAAYQEKFARVMAYLQAGDCYQINLAQRFSAEFTGDEWQAFLTLNAQNAAPFSAFIRLEQGAILSLSPERFLKLSHGEIETKPIKGTRPRSSSPEQDAALINQLQRSEKDRAENLMIVDLLRNDIGRVAAAGTVNVPHLFAVESFPAVHHLVSTIRAQLAPQYSATDLLRACFPGGSITGAPKVRAMQIIEELEPHRRALYCGSIGYISRCGAMDSNICIRTLIAEGSQLYTWAGGGIVADSQVEIEYQEMQDKLSKILPILGIKANADHT